MRFLFILSFLCCLLCASAGQSQAQTRDSKVSAGMNVEGLAMIERQMQGLTNSLQEMPNPPQVDQDMEIGIVEVFSDLDSKDKPEATVRSEFI